MNEIQIYQLGKDGFSTVISDETGWFCTGYEELKSLDAQILINNIKNKTYQKIDFSFATKIDLIIESVLESVENKKWINVKEI